jgi:hypothetical protein
MNDAETPMAARARLAAHRGPADEDELDPNDPEYRQDPDDYRDGRY